MPERPQNMAYGMGYNQKHAKSPERQQLMTFNVREAANAPAAGTADRPYAGLKTTFLHKWQTVERFALKFCTCPKFSRLNKPNV